MGIYAYSRGELGSSQSLSNAFSQDLPAVRFEEQVPTIAIVDSFQGAGCWPQDVQTVAFQGIFEDFGFPFDSFVVS
jgi:hypothetical protein